MFQGRKEAKLNIKRKNVGKRKVKKIKAFHFQGRWKNGDPLVIRSEGFNKRHAFANMLRLVKLKRYPMNKGDGFKMSYKTNEETGKIHGHCTYIVYGNKVEIN